MEATIQGEIHGYDDFEAALDDPLSSYDALIVEGRDDDGVIKDLSTGYTLFLMGYIPAMKINSSESLEQDAREAGIGYHNDIDADVHTIYYEMSSPLIRALSFLFVAAALWIMLLFALFLAESLSLFGLTSMLVIFLVSLIAIFVIPLVFTSLIAVVSAGCLCGELRDDYMIDEVESLVEEHGYERVLVRCGQSHVSGVANGLEEDGWNVEQQQSQSRLGRSFRLLGRPFNLVCRVVGAGVVRVPGGRPPYLDGDE